MLKLLGCACILSDGHLHIIKIEFLKIRWPPLTITAFWEAVQIITDLNNWVINFQLIKRGKPMNSTFPDKNRYQNLVAGISVLNGCKLMNIDFPDQVINLSGSLEAVQACYSELKDMLGRYQAE
jgi:hypothetical protein